MYFCINIFVYLCIHVFVFPHETWCRPKALAPRGAKAAMTSCDLLSQSHNESCLIESKGCCGQTYLDHYVFYDVNAKKAKTERTAAVTRHGLGRQVEQFEQFGR